ncbi:MAG: hypothetical protein WKG00_10350 [Polyangiaceae bacterium]
MDRDTSPEAQRIVLERLRSMTMEQRLEEGIKLSLFARQMMRAGIRMRHPEYAPEAVEEALARLLWGDLLYRAARPGMPLLEP